ncbi:LCCL domain-containing protein [Pararhodobacter aggregans]
MLPLPGFRPGGRRLRALCAGTLGLIAATLATSALACPDPGQNGQMIRYNGAQLLQGQSESVTAGGNVNLGACPGVPGNGRVVSRPDFTLNFARNNPGYDLELRVDGTCDTVLLVNGPDGRWSFNDDAIGTDPRVVIPSAAVGEYDIWVGTFGASTCAATLQMRTSGGGAAPQPQVVPQLPPQIQQIIPQLIPQLTPQTPQLTPQIPQLPQLPQLPLAPPQLVACPNPALNGQPLSYSGQQLRQVRSLGLTAGGNIDLDACASVPGHGHVALRADFTLSLTQNLPNYDLEIRADGTCDPVLLVRAPDGQWHFNDDADGLNSRLRLTAAATGEYDIWVGTYGAQTCAATLRLETVGGLVLQPPQIPQPPQILLCPNPAANGQFLNYSAGQLLSPRNHGVVAGGATDLADCAQVPGHGHVAPNPDFTLNLTQNALNATLQLGVDGTCDTVLLVRGPNGQYAFNDDTNGLNPELRFQGAQTGEYDIWVGTFGQQTCQATLIASTQGLPVPQPQPQPQPLPVLCPNPALNGNALIYSAAQVQNAQSVPVTAGGPVDLTACAAAPGHGRVAERPDFTLTLTQNAGDRDLEFRVDGTCDPVLLIYGPDGQYSFNDDANGLNSALRIAAAQPGAYDIWVGTYGQQTCAASLALQSYAPAPPTPPEPPPAPYKPGACPDPGLTGTALSYDAQGLWTAQSFPVVAGGNLGLRDCPVLDVYGNAVQQPDFSLTLTGNLPDHALEFRVEAACDPVLLVHGPDGNWSFNDDADGLNSRLRLENAPTGTYSIWAGTYGSATCEATFSAETFASAQPRPQGISYPQPMVNGERVDWCRTYGADCGQPAADAFCQRQGHGTAAYWRQVPASRTLVLGGMQLCTQQNGCGALADVICTPASGGSGIEVLPDPGNMTAYRGQTGTTLHFEVTGAGSGSVWGSDVYTDDSRLARAAVHAGLLQVGQTGTVAVTVLPGQQSYTGSTRNGVQSATYGQWSGSYRFETRPAAPPAGGK